MTNNKLCPVSLGLSLGITWGISVLIMGLLAHLYMFGKPFVAAVGAVYVGYDPSIAGSIIGGIIGFVDAFIYGFIIAWLYNTISGCCDKKEHKKTVKRKSVKAK